MTFQNKTTQKLISIIIIIAIIAPAVLLSAPKKADAFAGWVSDFFAPLIGANTTNTSVQNTTQTALKLKDLAKDIGKQVLMTVAKKALQEMTKSTINWINSGFHGSPLFVENPKSFFKDIGKFEIKNLVDTFGYDPRRFPFGKQFALNTINAYKSQLETNAQYTLSNVINDPALLDRYRNDFNVGGWNGFLINTQYPQNNYLGFQMLATEELGRRLAGTETNAVQTVKEGLQQGLGFLSPETCADNNGNNEYNKTLASAWQRPSWNSSDYDKKHPVPSGNGPEMDAWYAAKQTARTKFLADNTCKNLVRTTPGSVVGDQIKGALGSGRYQMELATAMGNSISAVLDALLSKFIGSGLNSLASKVNPQAPKDDWEYAGQILGSPVDGGSNSTWDSGPDEELRVDDFKKHLSGETTILNGDETITSKIGNTGNGTYTPGDIENTNTEVQLINNISQLLGQIWPKTRELDICIPGPDIGWQDRIVQELERNSEKLLQKSNDDDPNEAARARSTFNELKFAVGFFKDWINNKMMLELPHSIQYMDAVDEIETIYQESDELVDAKRLKVQALARLQTIKTALSASTFATQPTAGSAQEKALVLLKKQYNAISEAVSSTNGIENRKNELAVAKEKLDKLNTLLTQCNAERTAKGWSIPSGVAGGISTLAGKDSYGISGTEKNIYCEAPIKGGYDHESFLQQNFETGHGLLGGIVGGLVGGPVGAIYGAVSGSLTGQSAGTVTHPDVPLVNAKKVFKFDKAIGSGTTDIEMSCDIIYKSTVLDYKKNIPGLTGANVTDPYGDTGGGSGPTPTSFPVSLTASPSAGPAPLNNVTLTATVTEGTSSNYSGYQYFFFCDDPGPLPIPLTTYPGKTFGGLNITSTTATSPFTCNYTTTGTHTAKTLIGRSFSIPVLNSCDAACLNTLRSQTAAYAKDPANWSSTTTEITVGSVGSNTVTLSATPSSGTAPLNNVKLTTTNSDSSQYYHYYFYCDRTQADQLNPTSFSIPPGYINIDDAAYVSGNTYTSPVNCSYNAPGTYHPKVISVLSPYDANRNWIGYKSEGLIQTNTTVVVQ